MTLAPPVPASTSTSPTTAATTLAAFCADLRWANLPAEVRERTLGLVLDLLGVTLRGSAEASSRAGIGAALALHGPHEGAASVIGGGRAVAAGWAALANGTSAHAIEMDDVTTESSLHPGVAVIPAALAVAEERAAPPAEFLAAVVAGYEITMRVGNALNPAAAYRRGFHPTGVAGAFGAAVAAGRLLGLDPPALTNALGITGSMASGSMEYLTHGAWTKRLNAGWAAHAGVVAAHLAAAGFVGPSTVLEGRLGLLHGYSEDAWPDRLLADLGPPLQVMRVSIKPYACCRYNHAIIDAVLALRERHGVRPEDVERLRLGVLRGGALLVADPIEQKRSPRNVVDAQFSAPFAAAVALVHGAAGFEAYTQANVDDPRVRELMARTDCFFDDTLDAVYPREWPGRVEAHLHDGRTLDVRVDYALGEPQNPVPRAALVDKFVSLTSHAYDTDAARRLAERILALEAEPDLRGLGAALRGARG